jgi:hypothetical protein
MAISKHGCKVWLFAKPGDGSTIASGRIGQFIANTLDLPLVWSEEVTKQPTDDLIIVNGAFAFCKHLPALAVAVRKARRIVWVQNDYTISPPKATSAGESPFRAAFRLRAKAGLPAMTMWTTCKPLPAGAKYINWNQLTYAPLPRNVLNRLRSKATPDLFYYGAFREGRIPAFDRFFKPVVRGLPITVSSTSPKFERYVPRIAVQDSMVRGAFYETLAVHGMGLYIEDERSHRLFHSPANRFYEMLSAGLPMVFQPEAVPMLQEGGVDVRNFVVDTPQQVVKLMKKREDIGAQQRKMWGGRDYVKELGARLTAVYEIWNHPS